MSFADWISYRYTRASKGRFLSFLNFISIAGVAIGVMALIVVLSVMTGFGNNLREKIIGATPHVVVEKETGVQQYRELEQQLRDINGVEAVSPYIQGNIFLEHYGHAVSQIVRGILPESERNVIKIEQYLDQGNLTALSNDGIIIGSELARYYGYAIGDRTTLIAPGSGMAGRGWRYEMEIVGIFSTGMVDYDTNLVLVHLDKAREIFGLPEGVVSGIGLRLDRPQRADAVKNTIQTAIGYSFLVKTWIDVNRNLFEALFLEKWGLFIILTLMVLVAAFNIVSTLIVTVTSKTHDIGILKSIGASEQSIHQIFTKQGIFIGVLGIFWGVVSGLAIAYILHTYVKVPEQIYSIDRVPVEIKLGDLLAIVAAALCISFLATVYPARRAAKLQPVEALRYE